MFETNSTNRAQISTQRDEGLVTTGRYKGEL